MPQVVLVVIDMQERLFDAIDASDAVCSRTPAQ